MSLLVRHGGALSLLQDGGRHGWQRLGLCPGGPVDGEAFHYANLLLGNAPGSTAVEISLGGLALEAQVDTCLCLTGADMPLSIDGASRDGWTVHPVAAGEHIEIGYAERGCRAYLAVAGGFHVDQSFGSSATVVREGIGGLRGSPLAAGDVLPCATAAPRPRLTLPPSQRPHYSRHATLRVIPGYQQRYFDRIEQRRFFGAPWEVSERCDRMGYRLEGSPVTCEIDGILSEGICAGAIQIPPDGQPIVLLGDRQTIGGYPKIGAALSPDTARLAQLTPGSTVHFAPVTPDTARRVLTLYRRFALTRPLREVGP